ncbi:MAG: hypothetical protein AAF653_02195, partial [Chloroflexota bacterium]
YEDPSSDWVDNVLNLSQITSEKQETIYVDTVHYTRWFMEELAWVISTELVDRELLTIPLQENHAIRLTLREPPADDSVHTDFELAGWALDTGVDRGDGTGVDYVEAFVGSECSGQSLGTAVPAVHRWDVVTYFGLDSSFSHSGFQMTIDDIKPGPFTFTVCAHSSKTQSFETEITRTITVIE